jgi:hypothetical protein
LVVDRSPIGLHVEYTLKRSDGIGRPSLRNRRYATSS